MNTRLLMGNNQRLTDNRNNLLDEIKKSYSKLDSEYLISIFLGGLCFLFLIGKLGWVSGIGWFCISRFLSLLITRIDLILYISKLIKIIEFEENKSIKFWLN